MWGSAETELNAPAAHYKRRRVGRNLRLSRADPMLCFGQPSPLWCILLSPQGFATLRGPHLPRPETLRIPGAGLDDAYKVFILIRFLLNPN